MLTVEAEATIAVRNPHALLVPDVRHVRGVTTYHEDRVMAHRQLRDDPLGQMHARRQLGDGSEGEARYRAGRAFQVEHEAAGVGRLRSSGDICEPVDNGGRVADGITDRQLAAIKRREEWRGLLGKAGFD